MTRSFNTNCFQYHESIIGGTQNSSHYLLWILIVNLQEQISFKNPFIKKTSHMFSEAAQLPFKMEATVFRAPSSYP